MKHYFTLIKQNPVWSKVLLFSLTLFFLRIADGIISFWAPNQIQNTLGSSVWMGIVISFQSVIGFIADLVLPGVLKKAHSKLLLILAVIMSALTSVMLIGSVYFPYVLLLLIAMAVWGIYYELINFAQYQFMGQVVPSNMHSSAWGVYNIFYNLSYFLGPLLAAFIFLKGLVVTESVFISLLVIGLFMLIFLKIVKDAPGGNEVEKPNPLMEFKHWVTLSRVIWPVIIVTLLLGIIDSTFWTTGAVWTEKLAETNSLGSMFLPFYTLPSVILGLIIAKWGVYKGKKILSEKFLILAGLFLMLMAVSGNIFWILGTTLISSAALAVCYPLIEGVYTDLVARMGHEGKDMVGLTSSVVNVAYIVWPPVAGLIAAQIGERLTFSYMGLLIVLTGIGLLFVTPKKLRLPQSEIETWQ